MDRRRGGVDNPAVHVIAHPALPAIHLLCVLGLLFVSFISHIFGVWWPMLVASWWHCCYGVDGVWLFFGVRVE
jgi:hypothetical protein